MDAAGEGSKITKEGNAIMTDVSNVSPWKYSDSFFKDVLRLTVPERPAEIDNLFSRLNVTIEANEDEACMRFCVDIDTHVITIATSPLRRMWAHAYAYLTVYDLIAKATSRNPKTRELPATDERFITAMAVLKWAMIGDAKVKIGPESKALGPQEYPANIALPFDPSSADPTHKVASDLVVMSLGYILLHEIAHIELKHPICEGADSIIMEREADAWAAAFLLDKCDLYAKQHGHKASDVRMKRLLALTIGELWAVHFEVHLGVPEATSHPPTYERLANLLDQQANDGADIAWAMAATVLQMHYQARYGMADEGGGFDDFRECYQFYADLMSKKPKRDF